jgi:hypothetical protein
MRVRVFRPAAAAAALISLALGAAPGALADGDPASDVLLGQTVFFPYSPTSRPLQQTLTAATLAAAKAGFPIKVALIQDPTDLGVVPSLFGKPQQYAHFLDQEISFQGKQHLLVVMKTGYGVEGMPAAVTAAAALLPKPAGGSSNALARAGGTAVAKLAAAAGHPIKGVPGLPGAGGGGGNGSGARTTLVVVLALAALATAGALVAVRRRAER